ncbi:MAG: hypothetical protein JWP59_1671 [Massilia sp.]|nr:hypothetical protein [Massilia sp.]
MKKFHKGNYFPTRILLLFVADGESAARIVENRLQRRCADMAIQFAWIVESAYTLVTN